ncbi:MAG: DNA polymerase III subunit gamma/tau [Melioribacteraceae bacterium]|nr:DNA polymerase III subunit gamma/tau [Melioribacteraceae bacterium]MCF8265302.1 DNA polymerase III subunit gamma/tau [Melioribacteraceae bacterium]MCF8412771.1 DNA polymerase III subunit gamma/tau [Melioribacteraceae bacterium]
MSYVVTARKYRPQIFDDVVGQQHISQTLKNAIMNDRIAHAYIFAGPRGVGKTTTARILAKSLNCTNQKKGEPCGECEMCNSFSRSQSLDIIEIDGASNRRIEEIRQLRESVKYAPTHGSYKIYIIDEVHMLTTESFNALLKTLEEPPDHTIFIFATTDIHKVPLTIISRCQRFDFRRIELQEIKTLLKSIAESENIDIDDQALTLIAKKADGALRDAQSLFDQVASFCGNKIEVKELSRMLNLIDEDAYFDISDAILSKDFNKSFEISQIIYENGWNFIDFANGLVEHFRNIAAIIIGGSTNLIETAEVYKSRYMKYKSLFTSGDVIRILNFLSNLQSGLRNSVDQKLKLEIALFHLIGLEKSSTISDLLHDLHVGSIKTSSPGVSFTHEPAAPLFTNNEQKFNSTTLNAKKLEPKIEMSSFKTPEPTAGQDFDIVVNKWKEFIDAVKSEKMIGNNLVNSKPVQISDNEVFIELEHPEDKDLIIHHTQDLSRKSKEIFGRKIEFNFSKEFIGENSTKMESSKTAIVSSSKQKDKTANVKNSSLVNAVISELGGKEILK